MVEAVVEFGYEAEQKDELSLKVGDVVKNVVQSEGGWWEGEVNGKRGMFPENFVKVVKADNKATKTPSGVGHKESPQRRSVRELAHQFKDNVHLGPLPPKKKEKKKKCKAMFDYTPENEDELELKEGEVVDFIREVEDGWWEGTKNGKNGVFPSNFVEMVEDAHEESGGPPEVPDRPPVGVPGEESVASVHEIRGKKVIGVGLGNIFQGGPIKLRTAGKKDPTTVDTKKPPDVKETTKPQPPPDHSKPPEPSKPPPPESNKPSVHDHVKHPPPEPSRPPVVDTSEVVRREKKEKKAVVRFSYTAEQPDELSLKEGETIAILDTNLEDEGWWKGEVNGKIGVFPDNFVELLAEEMAKPKKPPPPAVSLAAKTTSGPTKTGVYPKLPEKVPVADPHLTDAKKHDAKPETKPKVDLVNNKNKDLNETTNDRVAPAPVASKKPSLPPPVSKKPPPPKPEPPKASEPARVETKPSTVVAAKDNKTKDAIEDVEEVDTPGEQDQDGNFESLEPTSQKLVHLTASRVKGPKKRPPSTFTPQGENERTSSVESDEQPSSSSPVSAPQPTIPIAHHEDVKHHPPQKKKQFSTESEKKGIHEHMNHHSAAPPRPPEPSHSAAAAAHHGGAGVAKMIEELQREVKELRANTISRSTYTELRADYDRLKQDVESFKASSNKKVRELMLEVDEEKKLRLNTQVEIERIKKLLAETNV